MTTIRGIENETFKVTDVKDVSELTHLMDMPLARQADDSNHYTLERILTGRKKVKRSYLCVRIDGEFVNIM